VIDSEDFFAHKRKFGVCKLEKSPMGSLVDIPTAHPGHNQLPSNRQSQGVVFKLITLSLRQLAIQQHTFCSS
jgi:hypothetical protein